MRELMRNNAWTLDTFRKLLHIPPYAYSLRRQPFAMARTPRIRRATYMLTARAFHKPECHDPASITKFPPPSGRRFQDGELPHKPAFLPGNSSPPGSPRRHRWFGHAFNTRSTTCPCRQNQPIGRRFRCCRTDQCHHLRTLSSPSGVNTTLDFLPEWT